MALVIALGTFGVGYATWSDNVTIEETVLGGTWEVELTSPGYNLATDTCEDATCSVSVASAETLTVNIGDAPPCCSGNITFTIENVGTIPAKITKVEFYPNTFGKYGEEIDDQDGSFTNSTTSFTDSQRIELPPCTRYYFDLDDDPYADLSLHLQTGLIGQQFDPPDVDPGNTTVAGKVNFHVEAGASGNLTTQFDLEFEAVPWNQP
jgi:hypothetical protein